MRWESDLIAPQWMFLRHASGNFEAPAPWRGVIKGTWICIIVVWALPKLRLRTTVKPEIPEHLFLLSSRDWGTCFGQRQQYFCYGDLHTCLLQDAASHLVVKGTFVQKDPTYAAWHWACKSIPVCIDIFSMFIPMWVPKVKVQESVVSFCIALCIQTESQITSM